MSNTRKSGAKDSKEEFADLASVILKTRNAIIQKVKHSIPENHTGDIVFLIAFDRSGNTTTFCFLRGDEMVLKDAKYDSVSDKSHLIGHDGYSACTLLPNIAVVDGMVLVDFPCFYYKNEQLNGLGLELALKALISEYHPKILVQQAITHTSGAFEPIRNHGQELARLIGNKPQACMLGLTKYQKDDGYIALSDLSADSQDRVSRIDRIKKKEDTFLQCLGIQHLIRFDRLENPLGSLGETQKRDACLKTIKKFSGQSQVNAEQCLASEDNGLLERLFTSSYIDNSAEISNSDVFNSFELLSEAYEQGSLIKAVISGDTGALLHLPEMPAGLAYKLDKQLVRVCVEHYEQDILALNIDEITQLATRLKQHDACAELEKQLGNLASILRRLRGLKDREKLWVLDYRLNNNETKPLFKLPSWVNALSYIPKNTPESIVTLAKIVRDKKNERNTSNELLTQCAKDVSQLTNTLNHLLQIRKMVEDRDELTLIARNDSSHSSLTVYGIYNPKTNTTGEMRVIKIDEARDKCLC